MAYGAAAASVALMLAPLFRKVYIASSFTYADMIPNGSHPLLDPLRSTEDTNLVHDGGETARVHKIAHVATNDTALRHPLDRVQPQVIERQQRETALLAEVLESTQAWARELEAAAFARDRNLERIHRALPVWARRAITGRR